MNVLQLHSAVLEVKVDVEMGMEVDVEVKVGTCLPSSGCLYHTMETGTTLLLSIPFQAVRTAGSTVDVRGSLRLLTLKGPTTMTVLQLASAVLKVKVKGKGER